MLAAQQLLNKVRTEKPTLVESMRLLSEAYIELACCSVSHLRKQQHGMTFMFRHKHSILLSCCSSYSTAIIL